MYIKYKNSFLKRFSSLQNEKACFEAFCLQNLKNMFLKRFTSLQNEKPRFWSDFMFIKWEKHVFEAFFIFTKWKNTILKHFSCQNEKKRLSRLKYLQITRSGLGAEDIPSAPTLRKKEVDSISVAIPQGSTFDWTGKFWFSLNSVETELDSIELKLKTLT